MTAHPADERLSAYLDDELDAPERAFLDAHLRDCAECAEHLADLASMDDAARRVPLTVPEGYFDDFAPRVRARLAKTPAKRRLGRPVWGWAVAAALLLAVITPLAWQQRSTAPSTAEEGPARVVQAPAPAGARVGRDEDAKNIPAPTLVASKPQTAPLPAAAAP